MLIVAMPKCAGTSLMTGLGQLLGVPYTWTASKKFKCDELTNDINFTTWWTELPKLHRDAFEWKAGLREFTTDDQVHKQHIIPTINNLGLIGNDYIFLHRDSAEIVQAHARFKKTVVKNPQQTVQELDRSKELHLLNIPRIVITFEDLIRNPKKQIIRIMDEYELHAKFPPGWELPRERFSGFTPPAGSEKVGLHMLRNKTQPGRETQ